MDLEKELLSLKAALFVAMQRISALEKENAELRARLKQNSGNSSKPPSSDGYRKAAKIIPPRNGKKGGQAGHKGDTLHQVSKPDVIIECTVDHCPCGHRFTPEETFVSEKRQVFDIPEPKIYVTEYQILSAQCPSCGKIHKGTSPDSVPSPVQYGKRMKAFVSMLNTQCNMPLNKIKQLTSDLFGVAINESTIQSVTKELYTLLEDSEKQIKSKLLDSKVLNVDETGIRIDKKLHWIHTASNESYTYLFAHKKRGKEAIYDGKSIIADFTNWLTHDCWNSYFGLLNASHTLCNAHILRELQSVMENRNNSVANKMHHFLLDVKNTDFKTRITNRDFLIAGYQAICREWEIEEPPQKKEAGKKGRQKKSKSRNLLERLIEHQDKILAFAFNEEINFTNNLAERDLRHVKLKQKISNCFRSFKGAEIYSRIASFISSARKNNKNVFEEIYNSFIGYNFLSIAAK